MVIAAILLACFTPWLTWLLWLRQGDSPITCGRLSVPDSAVSLATVIRNGGFLALSRVGIVLSIMTTSGLGAISFPHLVTAIVGLMLLRRHPT